MESAKRVNSLSIAEKPLFDAEINVGKDETEDKIPPVNEQISLMEVAEKETVKENVIDENFAQTAEENVRDLIDEKNDNDLLNKENEIENLSPRKNRKRKVSESGKEEKCTLDEKDTNNRNEELTDEEVLDKEKNKEDEKNSTEEMGMPAVQGFGKGKRARIPNKRYSDIALAPSPKIIRTTNLENGEKEKEKITALPFEKIESETSGISSPLPKRLKIGSVDLSNPNFLKPFKYGWKRELVWRSVGDVAGKRNGDIYYYSPEGKKLRSMREVTENLKNKELSTDDFTFFKEPLGLNDPEKEIIRDAKIKSANIGLVSSKKNSTQKAKKIMSPKVTSPKLMSSKVELKSPINDCPKLGSPTGSGLEQTEDGKLKPTKSSSNSKSNNSTVESGLEEKSQKSSTLKVKITSKPKTDKKTSTIKHGTTTSEEEVSMPGKKMVTRKSAKWSQNTDSTSNIANKPCQPCSIRCPGVQGVVPTLQCRLCLCLYHNECVGMVPSINIPNYVCKNCQLEQGAENKSAGIAPPPLTPITALQSVTNQPTGLPKLQRIPKSPDIETTKNEMEETEKSENIIRPTTIEESASILGHVTSWLPQNSRIQLDNNQQRHAEVAEPARPQYIEILGGRKFLIIPKYNVVSVTPTVGAVRSIERTRCHDDTDLIIGQTADVSGSVKTEPISPSKPESSQTIMDIEDNEIEPSLKNTDLILSNVLVTSDSSKNSSPKKKTLKLNNITNVPNEKSSESGFMENYLQNLAYGYSTLLYVFQYLKVQDLLRSGCVCTMWRDIASHPLLWRTVRMKNSQVHSFEGLANTLQKHGTIQLDLRKMLLTNCDERWPEFSSNIGKVETLRKIELCRCPASVVENLTESNPKLEVVNAVTIRCETMNLEGLANWTHLRELRLKSTTGLSLKSDIDSLKSLLNLKTLSLTSVKDLHTMKLEVIAELSNLEILDLGECTDFPENFGKNILLNLKKLEKLRLEKGQGNCHTFEILDAVKDMAHLEQLELVNFDIKAGFDKALGACRNIKKLLIIPTYISQSATTNHMVLGGVLRLQKSLSHFVWGVTLELLRVTELFVDQCEEPDKKEKKEKKLIGNGDSIPVLKPVPLIIDDRSEIPPALEPPQVEILALPGLQKLLLQSLPTTRVKILKIPFHATWRQSITDAVN